MGVLGCLLCVVVLLVFEPASGNFLRSTSSSSLSIRMGYMNNCFFLLLTHSDTAAPMFIFNRQQLIISVGVRSFEQLMLSNV